MTRLKLLLPAAVAIALLAYLIPGCDRLITETRETTIAGHPLADFTVAPDSGCEPLTVNLQDRSVGPRDRAVWYIYRGSSVEPIDSIIVNRAPNDDAILNADTSYTFTEAGVYGLRLTIFNTPIPGSRDSEYEKRPIVVGTSVLDFGASDTVIFAGNPVTFAPSVYDWGAVTTWNWSFGDGTSSQDSAPTHIYNDTGLFDVSVTATGPCGQKIITDTGLVRVFAGPDLRIFTDITEGCIPLSVSFMDSTVIDPASGLVASSRSWNVGGGSPGPQDSVRVTYNTSGTKDVILTKTFTAVVDNVTYVVTKADTLEDYITVWSPTSADFSAVTPTESCYRSWSQFQVLFRLDSIGDYDTIKWHFGDTSLTGDSLYYIDSTGGTNPESPIHAYTYPGTFSVRVEAIGPCGNDVTTRPNFISLYKTIEPTDVAISVFPPTGDTSMTFEFEDLTTGMVKSWLWTFGDVSDPASGKLASHKYTVPGAYWIKLTVGNPCNSVTDSIQLFVDSIPTPPAKTAGP